jgi:hypothetical protein
MIPHGLTALFEAFIATLTVLSQPFGFDPASAAEQEHSQRWPALLVIRFDQRPTILLRHEHVLGEQVD